VALLPATGVVIGYCANLAVQLLMGYQPSEFIIRAEDYRADILNAKFKHQRFLSFDISITCAPCITKNLLHNGVWRDLQLADLSGFSEFKRWYL